MTLTYDEDIFTKVFITIDILSINITIFLYKPMYPEFSSTFPFAVTYQKYSNRPKFPLTFSYFYQLIEVSTH